MASSNEPAVVPGIQNLGNTCFFNAILQALASLESFVVFLHRLVELSREKHKPNSFITALMNCIDDLQPARRSEYTSAITPKTLNDELCSRLACFRGYKQQDSQELLQFLMEIVETEQKECFSKNQGLCGMYVEDLKGIVESMKHQTRAAQRGGGTGAKKKTKSGARPLRNTFSSMPSASIGSYMGASQTDSICDKSFHESLDDKYWNPLHGLQGSVLVCRNCQMSRPVKHDRFMDISLSLGLNKYTTLDECLRRYTAPETIEGVECFVCSLKTTKRIKKQQKEQREHDLKHETDPLQKECIEIEYDEADALIRHIDTILNPGGSPLVWADPDQIEELEREQSVCDKKLVISRSPQVFCFHFNRKIFTNGKLAKLNTHVSFPMTLDMQEYCIMKSIGHETAIPNGTYFPSRQYDPAESRRRNGEASSLVYKLKAVILHEGNERSGHFCCYRRLPDGSQWFLVSDERVRPASVEEIQQSCAYMLFYERNDVKKSSVFNLRSFLADPASSTTVTGEFEDDNDA